MQRLDLVGQTFGRLTVIQFVEVRKGETYWLCRCTCGTKKIIHGQGLRAGNSSSCGCYRKEQLHRDCHNSKHGMTTDGKKASIYTVWQNMLARCKNPNRKDYKNYGGRRISVCRRWHKFENFYADVGNIPEYNGKQLTLDRKDTNGNYCKSNCQWATRSEQARNRRNL